MNPRARRSSVASSARSLSRVEFFRQPCFTSDPDKVSPVYRTSRPGRLKFSHAGISRLEGYLLCPRSRRKAVSEHRNRRRYIGNSLRSSKCHTEKLFKKSLQERSTATVNRRDATRELQTWQITNEIINRRMDMYFVCSCCNSKIKCCV